MTERQRIAVVGAGISGLATAHLLRGHHDVTIFEAAPRAGGHTDTVEIDSGGTTLALDLGFIVFNRRTYPMFDRLLSELGVASQPSDMSFSVRCERCGLEYCGSGLGGFFAQRRNLARPIHYRMLLDILRFHRVASRYVGSGAEALAADTTFDDFLEAHRFRGPVVSRYLKPMVAAIWSTEPGRMGVFPIRMLFGFLHNHGMLTVADRPRWRVVTGGSRRYVEAFERTLGRRLRTATPVRRIVRASEGSVELHLGEGRVQAYDQVVVAVHSDQALRMLEAPTEPERRVLGAIEYQSNDVVLHTDERLLPRRRAARASWNYHLGTDDRSRVQVTYSLNRLQDLDAERSYCVTLNRSNEIDPSTVLARRSMAHPRFTTRAAAAQERWSEVSGVDRIHYAGAYWRWGFHEDGVRSAVRVAAALGVDW